MVEPIRGATMDWKVFTNAVGVGSIRKVLGRIVLEFLPPGAIGLLSLWAFDDFSKGFIVAILVWAPYLRIVHQENQRQQDASMAGDVGQMSTNVQELKGTLASIYQAVVPKLAPSEAETVGNLIQRANTQVDIVNRWYLDQQHDPAIYRPRRLVPVADIAGPDGPPPVGPAKS
jgi:hypothetical protein